MTWGNRFRLLLGMLVVVAVVAALTLVLNQREREAFSSNGEVVAVQYALGSDYGGIMVNQYVQSGDDVVRGQELFTVSSAALQKDVENGLEPESTDAYELDPRTGRVTYVASSDGTLSELDTREGGYVPGGQTVAVITQRGTESVTAQFKLDPVDYGRIEIGGRADVELPNRATLTGEVSDISVEAQDGLAMTTVLVDVPRLSDPAHHAFAQPGTPVAVTLTLRDDGVLAGPTDAMLQFLHRIGVR